MERIIVKTIYTYGLILSMTSMTAGLLLKFITHEPSSGPADLLHLGATSIPDTLMSVGIGILAATPLVNVVALMQHWARHRNFRMAGIAATVTVTLAVAAILEQG
jgi:uncharacterized membrane protein